MTRTRTLWAIAGVFTLAMAGLGLRIPTRLTLDPGQDTLIVNGTKPVSLGIRARDALGLPIWRPSLRYSELPETIARAE